MPGGFHPFHPGHKSLYDWAVGEFGKDNVYVAATNDTKERPFPFEVKKKLAAMAGVPESNFIQVNTAPFNARAYTDLIDSDTALVFVRSEKERNVTPLPDQMKIDKATKKPGNEPRYYRSYTGKDLNTADEMGYIAYGPTINFDFKGLDIKSASEIRANWPKMSDEEKLDAAAQMYGSGAEEAVNLLNRALGVKEPEMAEVAEPEQTKNKRDLLNKSLRAKGHQVVPNKKGYNRKKERQMKFEDIHNESDSYYDDVNPKVVELGRRLMKAAETADPEDSKMFSLVGGMLSNHDGNDQRLLNKLKKHGINVDKLLELMKFADEELPPFSTSDVPDPVSSKDDDEEERNESRRNTTISQEEYGQKHVRSTEKTIGQSKSTAEEVNPPGASASKHGGNVLSTLERIIDKKQAMPVSFQDGKGKVDMFTASAIMQVYDAVNDDNKRKMKDALSTKAGFMKMAKFAMGKIGEGLDEDSKFDRNFSKRIGYTVRGGAASDMMKKQAAQAQANNPDAGTGLGPSVLNIPKARKKAKEKGVRAPGSLRASPNTRDPKRLPESRCDECGLPRFIALPEDIQEKYEAIEEGKKKGVDGKVCWKGYKRMGTKMKGGKRVDNCVKMTAKEKNK